MSTSALAPFSLGVLLFAFVFLIVAGFLIWYALQRNDEVRAKFGHGKTIFELEAKKRRDPNDFNFARTRRSLEQGDAYEDIETGTNEGGTVVRAKNVE